MQIEADDGLPQWVCFDCTDQVNSALNLRNQSHSSEIKLLKLGHKRVDKQVKIQEGRKKIKKEKNTVSVQGNADNLNKTDNDDCFENECTDVEVSIEFNSLTPVKEEQDSLDGSIAFKNINNTVKKKTGLSRKEKRKMYLSLVEGELTENGPVKCRICKKTVSKWSSFISHTKLHLGFKFVCEVSS